MKIILGLLLFISFLSNVNAGNVANAKIEATVISQNSEIVVHKFDTEKISIELIGEVGNSDCPIKYYLKIKQKDELKRTPTFGTCSDIVRSKIVNNKLLVSMSDGKGGYVSYLYDIKLLTNETVY